MLGGRPRRGAVGFGGVGWGVVLQAGAAVLVAVLAGCAGCGASSAGCGLAASSDCMGRDVARGGAGLQGGSEAGRVWGGGALWFKAWAL